MLLPVNLTPTATACLPIAASNSGSQGTLFANVAVAAAFVAPALGKGSLLGTRDEEWRPDKGARLSGLVVATGHLAGDVGPRVPTTVSNHVNQMCLLCLLSPESVCQLLPTTELAGIILDYGCTERLG